MKKTVSKTVKGLLILLTFLVLQTSHQSSAGSMDDPLCSVMVGRNGAPRLVKDMGGEWTYPVLVFSNKDSNVYTGADTITGNLFWGNMYGDYLRTGNFVAQLYIEMKNEKLRKKYIDELKSDISKQPSLAMTGNPDLLTYVVYYVFFGMKKNIVSIRNREKFLDRDGDLIMAKNVQDDIPLDNKSDFKLMANGIISALNKAKNDPKIADRIREMQKYGNNMTDVSRYNSLRNLKIARGQKQDLTEIDLWSKLNPLWDTNNAKYTDPPKAIEYLNELISLKPGEAVDYYCRGVAYYCLLQYQLAIKDYDKAIRLKPDYAEAYNNRGLAYDLLGQYQRAIKDYDEAIHLKPDALAAYRNRAMVYKKMGQYQRAITDFDEAIRLKPDYAGAYYERGDAYYCLLQYQRAITDFDEAIRLKPDYAGAYNDRGLVYIISGNNQDGCRSLIRACELGCCVGYNLSKQKGNCQQK